MPVRLQLQPDHAIHDGHHLNFAAAFFQAGPDLLHRPFDAYFNGRRMHAIESQ